MSQGEADQAPSRFNSMQDATKCRSTAVDAPSTCKVMPKYAVSGWLAYSAAASHGKAPRAPSRWATRYAPTQPANSQPNPMTERASAPASTVVIACRTLFNHGATAKTWLDASIL